MWIFSAVQFASLSTPRRACLFVCLTSINVKFNNVKIGGKRRFSCQREKLKLQSN